MTASWIEYQIVLHQENKDTIQIQIDPANKENGIIILDFSFYHYIILFNFQTWDKKKFQIKIDLNGFYYRYYVSSNTLKTQFITLDSGVKYNFSRLSEKY